MSAAQFENVAGAEVRPNPNAFRPRTRVQRVVLICGAVAATVGVTIAACSPSSMGAGIGARPTQNAKVATKSKKPSRNIGKDTQEANRKKVLQLTDLSDPAQLEFAVSYMGHQVATKSKKPSRTSGEDTQEANLEKSVLQLNDLSDPQQLELFKRVFTVKDLDLSDPEQLEIAVRHMGHQVNPERKKSKKPSRTSGKEANREKAVLELTDLSKPEQLELFKRFFSVEDLDLSVPEQRKIAVDYLGHQVQ